MSILRATTALCGDVDEENLKSITAILETKSGDGDTTGVEEGERLLSAIRDGTRLLETWKRLVLTRDLEQVPVQSLIKYGVPDVLRGPVWKWFCKADEHPEETRTFDELVTLSYTADQDTRMAIEKDIRRTFPKHVLFETSQGQEQLSRVLCAYAAYDPHVGYCQGMGFIVALLLCYTSPEEAFWILRAIMCRPEFDLRSMLSPGMPKFAPAMRELTRFIEIMLPEVASKLAMFSVDPSIFASQWFITLFSYNMPFQLVARIWDLFFLKRWSIIFRVSIMLLVLVRKEFEEATDVETVLYLLKSIGERIHVEDVNLLIERAMRLNLDEDDARVLGNVARSEDELIIAE